MKKKLLALLLVILMLSISIISVSAKVIITPEFTAVDVHNAQILELFDPLDNDMPIMFATLMNNKAAERTEYVVSDIYSWQDVYTDVIFFYETGAGPFWNDAVHLDLTDNVFSFKLSQPLKDEENLAVIFDDGTSVWIEYVTEDDFYTNKYWVYDVYTPECLDVKVISYTEYFDQFNVPIRYAYVLADKHVQSVNPSPEKYIYSFTLPGQLGDTVIDNYNGIITITMPEGTDVSAMTPKIIYSDKAMVIPNVKSKQDFTEELTYTIIAEDNSRTQYKVIVQVLEKEEVYTPIPTYFWYPEWSNIYYPWWSIYYPPYYCRP